MTDLDSSRTSPSSGRPSRRDPAPGLGVWLALTAVVLVAISLRPGIVSVGPLMPTIIESFRLSHATGALLTSIPDILMGLLALPTPWLARRFGRNPVLLLALVLLSLAIAARAFSAGTASLLTTTVGVGAGIAVAGTLIGGFIKARFPTRAAMMMGLYATALSFGSTISAAATGPVATIAPGGWRFASGMWAVLGVFAILGWLAVTVKERQPKATAPQPLKTPARLPIGNRTAWLIALFFACNNFLFYALLAWTSPLYVEGGVSVTTAGLILASFTAAFMFGNPIFGWLTRSDDRRGLLALSAVLTLLGLIPIALAPQLAPFLFIPLCAFGLGGGFTLGMTLPLDNTHDVEEANVWNAFVLTVGYLIAAAGPLLVGYLRDLNGDFVPSLWMLVGVAVAMLALTPFLNPRPR